MKEKKKNYENSVARENNGEDMHSHNKTPTTSKRYRTGGNDSLEYATTTCTSKSVHRKANETQLNIVNTLRARHSQQQRRTYEMLLHVNFISRSRHGRSVHLHFSPTHKHARRFERVWRAGSVGLVWLFCRCCAHLL